MDDGTTPVEAAIGGGATGALLHRISLGIMAKISEEVVTLTSSGVTLGAATFISESLAACVLDGEGGGLPSVMFITVPAATEGAVPLTVAACNDTVTYQSEGIFPLNSKELPPESLL